MHAFVDGHGSSTLGRPLAMHGACTTNHGMESASHGTAHATLWPLSRVDEKAPALDTSAAHGERPSLASRETIARKPRR
jgi:hypothetical protein